MTSHSQIKYLNLIASLVGLTSVTVCVVLFLYVSSQLTDIYPESIVVSQKFQEESIKLWESLREVNINLSILRNRRETFRKILGRPLSTASNIGFSHNPIRETRRKPVRKLKENPIYSAASKTTESNPIAGQFNGYYAPPLPAGSSSPVTTTTKSSYAYDFQADENIYDSSTTASYEPPSAILSYAGSLEESNADEPLFKFQWEQIKPPTCNCKSEKQCPAGPVGIPGNRGQRGDNGQDGKPGDNGKLGDDTLPITPPINHCVMCPQGEPGLPGMDGKRGSRGLRGARGGDGSPGRNGHPGFPGAHGPEGPSGPEGEIGFMGMAGMDGHTLVGLLGPKGVSGGRGDMGLTGDSGLDGQIGLIGVPGQKGSRGNPGKKGTNGSPGDQGAEGEPGIDAEYCPCPRNRQFDVAASRLLRA